MGHRSVSKITVLQIDKHHQKCLPAQINIEKNSARNSVVVPNAVLGLGETLSWLFISGARTSSLDLWFTPAFTPSN